MNIKIQLMVAVGGNLPHQGSHQATIIRAALADLGEKLGSVPRQSRLFRTPAFPAGSGPDYANAAAVYDLSGPVDPAELLALLHRIEAGFGRERHHRWGPRTLDLDLIALDQVIAPDAATQRHWMTLPPADQTRQTPAGLILPHPRLQDRGFVLLPLNDIAPDWRHPVLGLTVAQMLAQLPPAALRDLRPVDPAEDWV